VQPAAILVVDDEQLICWSLTERLSSEGYRVIEAETAAGALAKHDEGVDLVLLDYRLPDGDGLSVLKRIKERDPDTLVILLTAYATIDAAVDAMKHGAYHFANKPFNLDEIALLVEKALETTRLRREVRALHASQAQPFSFDRIVGDSPALAAVKALLKKVASVLLRRCCSRAKAVLEGSGGKGHPLQQQPGDQAFHEHHMFGVARGAVESELFGHERGAFTGADRQKRGLFETAHGGTVFLNEIGDIVPALQAKLLRFLEEKTFKRVGGAVDILVDVRVIAAPIEICRRRCGKRNFARTYSTA
jgi:two-component system response regulator AtoC